MSLTPITRRRLPLIALGSLALLAPVLAGQDDEQEKTNLDIQEDEYFTTCDYDENGWLSFREAESSLHLSRAGFGQYDTNTDGQVTREEFSVRYRELLERTGAFRKPTPKGVTPITPDVEGEALEPEAAVTDSGQAFVGAYDTNVDGKLDTSELEAAAAAMGFPGVSPAGVLKLLDTDGSNYVEPAELVTVLKALGDMGAGGYSPLGPKASSIEELFGGNQDRERYPGATPRPPLIPGPVPPFRRLDLDNNGFIGVEDLERLSISAHTFLRPSAVLAGLDLDGDGKLSQEELEAALDG